MLRPIGLCQPPTLVLLVGLSDSAKSGRLIKLIIRFIKIKINQIFSGDYSGTDAELTPLYLNLFFKITDVKFLIFLPFILIFVSNY